MRESAAVLALMLLVSGGLARGDEGDQEFFERRIRPVFVEHCYTCHAAGAKKLGGGLLLDSRQGVQTGGDSGPIVVPGKPNDSLLIKAVRYSDDSVQMPPKGKLPAAVIADLEEWVRRGAFDPRDNPPPARPAESWEDVVQERARWWSLQPVQYPNLPETKLSDWPLNPVDHFILARLESEKLIPAAQAFPRTLARRLSLVLTGLPPAADTVENLVAMWNAASESNPDSLPNDQAIQARRQAILGKYIDSLLSSPHFGERWARHWLDVVRFTETHGNEWNYEVHHAWRYRDYLVRALNADVPYDQFIREHIAGDLLSSPRWEETQQTNESIIGTGFYRFGEVNHDDCISLRTLGYDIADNQIDTLTKAFQSMTVACARCHNHKLDAISMEDYYGLLGILRNSRLVSHCIDSPEVNGASLRRLAELKQELRKEIARVWSEDAKRFAEYLTAAAAKRTNRADVQASANNALDSKKVDKWVAATAAEKMPLEDPLEPWRLMLAATATDATTFANEWQKLAERWSTEDRQRSAFNTTQFEMYADFRNGSAEQFGWQVAGRGLRQDGGGSGDFAVHHDGELLVRAVLPAGYFTHTLSDKLNGTLRSPVLPRGKKHISFQVMGQRSSAVRLVSSHCQLNYKNYKALTSDELQWVTFSPPEDRDTLRTYAELMTMFDNPKFPDQLSALGGDTENYRLPWEKAAANPRSWFGVLQIVLHDGAEPPKADLSHLRPLFAEPQPGSLNELADRYRGICQAAVHAFATNRASAADVIWLDWLRRRELLVNQVAASPRLADLAREYRHVESQLALPRIIAGMGESGGQFAQPVFVRGDCMRPGEAAPHRFVKVLSDSAEPFASGGSGRLQLADRIASAQNPLTARVIVNRIWHHLFGSGLVRTVDDFGHVGELPSHPELLDYLATRLVEDGWSMKRLIRFLVLTQTFQMSNCPTAAAAERDPRNQLLQHYPARRMEAEAIRDSLLLVSGRLDQALFGPSVQPSRDQDYADRRLFVGPLDGSGRRSLYIKNNLMERPKFLETFNFPGGKVAQGRRDVTNVPAQALALLNDPFVLQQADVWAVALMKRPADSLEARIDFMMQTALNRPPEPEERRRFEQVARRFAQLHQVSDGDLLTSQPVWRDVAHAFFNLKEFIYIP